MGEWRDIKTGKQIVHVVSPIVSNKGAITYEEALNILETHNFYCIDKSYKENTKELIMLLQKVNELANFDPNRAEEIATELLSKINVGSNEIEKQKENEETNNEEKRRTLFKRRKK